MKKLVAVTIVIVFGLFMLTSCNIEKMKEKYGYTENEKRDGTHDEIEAENIDQQEGGK